MFLDQKMRNRDLACHEKPTLLHVYIRTCQVVLVLVLVPIYSTYQPT